jgi:O-antigen/teichoic acid export membrane protein
MNLATRFVLGIFTGAFSVVLKTVLNMATVPLLLSSLGPTPYGLFVLLINLLELALLLDMGFSEGTIKLLGEAHGKNDTQTTHQILGTSKWLYLGLALFAQLLGWGFKPLFIAWFNLPADLVPAAELGLTIIFAEISVGLLLSFCRAILNSHSLQVWNNLTDSMYHIMGNGIGLTVLLTTPWGIPGFLAARLAAAVLRLLILGVQVLKLEPELLVYKWHTPALRKLFSLSVHALLINFSIFVSHCMDQFVIARFLPLAKVAHFEIVFRCLAVVSQLGSKVCEGLMPLFARLSVNTQTDNQKPRTLFLKMSFVNNAVTCLLLLMISLHFPLLFNGFSSGKLNLNESMPVLWVAIGIFWSGALQLPASYYLYSSGHHRFLTYTSITTALCNLALSLALVKPMGIVGVALGTLIPNVIQHQLFLIPKVRQVLNISVGEYARNIHWAVGLPLLSAGLFTWGTLSWCHTLWPQPVSLPVALGILGVNTLIGGLLALIIWAGVTAADTDKALIIKLLKNPGNIKQLLSKT